MRRVRVTCPAGIRTISGERAGQMWDLSETGARLKMSDPPERGETVLLLWKAEQAKSRVVWTEDDMCGLAFETPIAPAVVAQTADALRVLEQPVASLNNILMGRRRSDSGAMPSGVEPEGQSAPKVFTIRLPRPGAAGQLSLSEAEQLFLCGAPTAHVVDSASRCDATEAD